jgi:hypothetical protein
LERSGGRCGYRQGSPALIVDAGDSALEILDLENDFRPRIDSSNGRLLL